MNIRRGRRLSLEATLGRYVSALRESLEEMTAVEEVLIKRVNYLSMALEDCFREINLLHLRLNILAVPPMEPIGLKKIGTLVTRSFTPPDGMLRFQNLLLMSPLRFRSFPLHYLKRRLTNNPLSSF
ncbi:hypothetical protein Hanom_Chr02g00125021 [Helianthus anomalus]